MTNTIQRAAFYQHPNETMRDAQDIRRGYAVRDVRAGRIRWSVTTGLCGGFVEVITKGKRMGHLQRIDLETAIALHELHQAGRIAVDKTTGDVRPVEES